MADASDKKTTVIDIQQQAEEIAGGEMTALKIDGDHHGDIHVHLSPGGSEPSPPRQPLHLCPDLAYKVDREVVVECLDDVIRKRGRSSSPLICLFHGKDDQCWTKLCERLWRDELPPLLGLDEKKAEVVDQKWLRWPAEFVEKGERMEATERRAEMHRELTSNLAKKVKKNGELTRAEIDDELAMIPGPVLVHSRVGVEEWRAFKDEKTAIRNVIEDYVAYWKKEWRCASENPLLVFLFVNYQSAPTSGWKSLINKFVKPLNETVEAILEDIAGREEAVTLVPELGKISKQHALDWNAEYELPLESKIYDIFEKAGNKPLPIDKLVEQLEALLDSQKTQHPTTA